MPFLHCFAFESTLPISLNSSTSSITFTFLIYLWKTISSHLQKSLFTLLSWHKLCIVMINLADLLRIPFLKRSRKNCMVRNLVHPYVALSFSYHPCSKSKKLYLSWLALFTWTPTIFFSKHKLFIHCKFVKKCKTIKKC